MGEGKAPDVLVIGAGVMGLAAAWAASARGLSVMVADAAGIAAGASGGVVGALAPYPPADWSAVKRFQRDALMTAPGFWDRIAAVSGRDPGYARTGRLIPLGSARARARAEADARAAPIRWRDFGTWALIEAAPGIPRRAAPFGLVRETATARLHPRAAMAALAGALEARGAVWRIGAPAVAVGDGAVRFADGRISAGAVILAAGVGTPALLAPLLGRPAGRAVKGQAALLSGVPLPAGVVTAPGLYVVGHANGTVGVGSTSEPDGRGIGTDGALDRVLARAAALVPALGRARVLERWAGLRPRAPRPAPMLGLLPGTERLYIAHGAHGIGFAIAPAAGAALAAAILGEAHGLPPDCDPAAHLDPA